MKSFRISILLAVATLVAIGQAADAAGQCKRQGRGKGNGPGGGACGSALATQFESLPVQELSDAEKTTVVRLREEEKLARDVYTTLGEAWSLPIFANIAPAEQRHMDYVALLVTRYELEDPVVDDAAGEFTNPELGALYAKLVATGRQSEEDALRVGATIEDLDLADVQKMIDVSDNQDIHLVANNLAKASRNHLRAFTRVIGRQGYEAYAAQHLSQEKVDEILAGDNERRVIYDETGEAIEIAGGGGDGGWGKGRGRGRGKGVGMGRGRGQGACVGQGRGQGPGKGCCGGAGPAPEEG